MRVLHVLSTNRLSGAENVAADICMMFDGEIEMAYCSPRGSIENDLNVRKVEYLPIEKLTYSELKKIVKQYKPDVIHAHDVRASILAALFYRNSKIVSHIHVNSYDMRKISIKSILYALFSFFFDKVLVVSESCYNDYIFKNLISSKYIYLRNIIYPKRIELLKENDKNRYDVDFVYIGRIAYQKNPRRVATVASLVLEKLPDVKFGIIGDGDLKHEMVDVFRSANLLDRVEFYGWLKYPYKALESAKCVLMCSLYEGLPISVIEAFALGVPIVSTPVDGLVSIVRNGHNGLLSNNDEELANFAIKLISNEKLYSNISNNCKESFYNINSVDNYKRQLIEIYR